MTKALCWLSREGCGCHSPCLSASCTASAEDNILDFRGTVTSTWRCCLSQVIVSPSTKPRSAHTKSPALNTDAVSKNRRHKGKSYTDMGERPTCVIIPAWPNRVRKVANVYPRDLVPPSFLLPHCTRRSLSQAQPPRGWYPQYGCDTDFNSRRAESFTTKCDGMWYSYRSVRQRAVPGVCSRGYCGIIACACPLRMAGYASGPEGRTTLPRRSVPWKVSPGHHCSGSGGRGRQSLTRRTPIKYLERKPCPKNEKVIRKVRRNRP